MTQKLFGRGRRGGVLLIAGAILGAAVAGPGISAAVKMTGTKLTTTTGDKRYVLKGTTLATSKTVETKIDKFNSTSFSSIADTTVNVPAAGFLQVVGDVSAKDDVTTTSGVNGTKLDYRLSVGSNPLSKTADSFELFLPDIAPTADQRENGSVNGVATVSTKGPVKVSLDAQVNSGGSATILGRSLSIVFVPKGKLPKTTKTGKTGTGNTGTGNTGTGNTGTGKTPTT